MRFVPSCVAVACVLAGCVAHGPPRGMSGDAAIQKKLAYERARRGGDADGSAAAAPLKFCLPPVQDPDGSTRSLDLGGAGGVTEVPSRTAAAGCDLMLQFVQHSGGGDFQYELSSAYSGQAFASGSVTNWVGVTSMVNGLVGDLYPRVAPGTAAYNQVALERRRATGVGQRTLYLAPPERQQQIDAAALEGDGALSAGNGRGAFAAYTRALSGSWSDDETSRRVRMALMKLVGDHPEYAPPVPEEARRRMVRAQALLKDSTEFSAYDAALGEMAAAAVAAPWWSDVYYNAALVAEKAGYIDDAMRGLKEYLAANPRARDARAVQDKIYALEVRADRAAH